MLRLFSRKAPQLTKSKMPSITKRPSSSLAKFSTGVYMPVPKTEGGTYAAEASLPKLPLPSLEETLNKYLGTVKPLSTPEAYSRTEALVNHFAASVQAQELQRRLAERRETTENWLIDWWNDYAYMSYRDSVVLNVSYFFHLAKDEHHQSQSLRAASLIKGAVEFKRLLQAEKLEADSTKAGALSMSMYQYMFNSCRVPQKGSDVTRKYNSDEHHYVVVAHRDRFYKVPTLNERTGEWLSVGDLERQLKEILSRGGKAALAVGALTSDNRDAWLGAREALVAVDARNEDLLRTIEASDLVVCLDDTKPVTRSDVARALWHGTGHNRWYDKSLQVIVFANGNAGMLCEHAMMDGTPTNRLATEVATGLQRERIPLGGYEPSAANAEVVPLPLDFATDAGTKKHVDGALRRLHADIDRHAVNVLAYEGLGKNDIKRYKVSPDAFVQMAMQLAYYKTTGKVPPTYESAATRRFKHGRTETCRSVSAESVAFVQQWAAKGVPLAHKVELARAAIAAQSSFMALAVEGRGVDRHLLGLRLCLQPGEQKHEMFTEPNFAESCHWRLSTSQIPGEHYDGWGWGEVVPDGFGIAYILKDRSVHFNIASLKSMPNADMKHYLAESLREMRDAFDQVLLGEPAAAKPVKSKL